MGQDRDHKHREDAAHFTSTRKMSALILNSGCPPNPDIDNDINIEVQMAEAIATEGADVGEEESDEADLVAIEVKGSIKTDEVKALHFSRHYRDELGLNVIGTRNFWKMVKKRKFSHHQQKKKDPMATMMT